LGLHPDQPQANILLAHNLEKGIPFSQPPLIQPPYFKENGMFAQIKTIFGCFYWSCLMYFLFLILVPFGYGAEEESFQITQAIQAKGALWVAGETSVTKLPALERKQLLGTYKPLLSPEEHEAVSKRLKVQKETGAPSALDWRGYNNYNYVTPVRNQGICGSCWAFAATAALESKWLISQNNPGADLNLSEQVLVSCSRAGSCSGGYIDKASDYIRNLGLPSENCFPYTAANNTCAGACSDYQKSSFAITTWHWAATTSPSVEALKGALYAYGPLVTTMDVYSDFFSYRTGVYSYVTGSYQGGHAILLVGYNDAGKYFIAKNSWGTGWGEGGYFKVAYGELNSPVEFGHYTIAYDNTPVDPPPPPSCTYTLSPAGKNFKPGGGTGKVLVTTSSGECPWTVFNPSPWISVDSANRSGGQGSGTVTYTVAPNDDAGARIGTMIIAGQTFTVKQAGVKIKGTLIRTK
jgi:Papain family cysteine protease/Putative binding domain, N-terminal